VSQRATTSGIQCSVTNIRLKFIQAFTANGARYYYFRRPGMRRVRLPGLPGSEEFNAAYAAALAAAEPRSDIGASRNAHGTVAALIGLYGDTADFKSGLASSTRESRWRILSRFREEHGEKRVALLRRGHIMAIIGGRPVTTQRLWLDAIRPLLEHAVAVGWAKENAAAAIKLKRPKAGSGYRPWGSDQVEVFRAHYPLGTRERLAFELLLNTMQRRGDIVRLGPQHIREDGLLHVTQQKTGVALALPVAAELRVAIDRMPAAGRHLTFLVTANATPFDAQSFGNWFRKACDAIGLQGFSSHGLRKAGMTRLADAGCSTHEIMSWSGHKTLVEVAHYTKAADQRRLAREALDKLNRVETKTVKKAESRVSKQAKKPKKSKLFFAGWRSISDSNFDVQSENSSL
jgi:integrase